MELARFILIFGALISLTLGAPTEDSDGVVKKAEVDDTNSLAPEDSGEKEEGDLQESASLQDYAAANIPYPYYQYYLVPVDANEKTVEAPVINGQGSISLPGLHVGATIGQGASHGGPHGVSHGGSHGGGAAAAAAAAAASAGGPGSHGVHHSHQSGGPSFAAAGSIAGTLQFFPFHGRPPVYHQPVHHVPVRPVHQYGGSFGGAGIHGVPVHHVGGGYGSPVHHGSYGIHGQPVYHHVIENHRPTYHVPVHHGSNYHGNNYHGSNYHGSYHGSYRPTYHTRPTYNWGHPGYGHHRDLEPFIVIHGLPNIHATGSVNVHGDGATTGIGGIHTTPGNPLVISLPEESPVFGVAQLIQRPFQVIGSLLNPQPVKPVEEKPHHTEGHLSGSIHIDHVHKPVHEKPVHEPVHHKPVHEPVHHKPVHEPVHHKPVHSTAQAVVHKPAHKPVESGHKPHYVLHETIHKGQYGPGYNKVEGAAQPTIKPVAGQFSKSDLPNEGSLKVPPRKKEELSRAEPNGADLPSDINSVDGVVGAEDKKDDLARSADVQDSASAAASDLASSASDVSPAVVKEVKEQISRSSDDAELPTSETVPVSATTPTVKGPAPTTTQAPKETSTVDSGVKAVVKEENPKKEKQGDTTKEDKKSRK